MSWIIVNNFVESNEKHLKLLNELGKEDKFFYVRKEFLDFDELDSSEKAELIEENYDLYKDGLLSLKTDVKDRIENRIYEIGNEILSQSVKRDKTHISVSYTHLDVYKRQPLPLTRGFGSLEPVTTRSMPDSIIALTQGGCFP